MKKILIFLLLILLSSCTINNNYYISVCDENSYNQLAGNGILPDALKRHPEAPTGGSDTGSINKKNVEEKTIKYKTIQVKGYYRKDGTYIKPHTRKIPVKE